MRETAMSYLAERGLDHFQTAAVLKVHDESLYCSFLGFTRAIIT